MKSGVVSFVGVVTGVTTASVGAVVSIVKAGISKTEEIFPAASVTVTVQSEYIPAANVVNVTVLLPDVADVVAEEQEPPYVIVPASVELNVNEGVVSFVGVGTGVTTASVGAVISIVKDGTCNTEEIFPAASVAVIVQSEYVPAMSALNVNVLFPDVADVVALLHEPPYVIVPASVELNVKLGVVSFVGFGTGVTTARIGAIVSIVKDGTCRTEEMFPAASVTVTVQSEYVPATSASNVMVSLPLVADVVAEEQEPPYAIVPASVELNVNEGVVSFAGVGTGVTTASTGASVSIVNAGISNTEEIFPAASVTVIVQSEYVPATSASNVIVLLPLVADAVADEQEPPYVIAPPSVELNVKFGVVSFVGLGTGVTVASVGAVRSMTNVGTFKIEERFPAASVTRIVQLEYVPATSVLNVTVLLPDVAEVVAEEHEPPYVIVPTSEEENVYDGVVL